MRASQRSAHVSKLRPPGEGVHAPLPLVTHHQNLQNMLCFALIGDWGKSRISPYQEFPLKIEIGKYV